MAPLRGLRLSLAALAVTALPRFAQSSSFGNSVVIDGQSLIISEPKNSCVGAWLLA